MRDKLAPEQLAKFRRGHEVGKLAWELFPGGINCAPAHPTQFKKSLELTRNLIEESTPVIYEAAFQHNAVLIFVDILVKTANGYHAYEVKSSLRISETYLTDAALQYNILIGSGINPLQFSIIHLNEHYRMGKCTNVDELFSIKNVTDLVVEKQEKIDLQIEQAKEAIGLKKSPPLEVGKHCYSPYPCDFIGHCWKNVPAISVFHIKGIPAEKRFGWMQTGIKCAAEIPLDDLTSKESQIIDIHLSGKAWINKDYARKIKSLQAPLLITFLTISPAVPFFDDCRPFQHVIVGFASKNQQGEMTSFIAEPGINPIQEVEKRLVPLLEKYQNILFAEPTPEMGLKRILKSYFEKKEFVDLSEIFHPINYYQAGIDVEASFAENLPTLLPEIGQKKIISHTIAGVKYLEVTNKDKDSYIGELSDYLTENLRRLQLLFEFLTKSDEEDNDLD